MFTLSWFVFIGEDILHPSSGIISTKVSFEDHLHKLRLSLWILSRIPFKEKLIIVENTGAHTPATLSSIFKGPPEAYLIELHTEIRVPSHKIIPHWIPICVCLRHEHPSLWKGFHLRPTHCYGCRVADVLAVLQHSVANWGPSRQLPDWGRSVYPKHLVRHC